MNILLKDLLKETSVWAASSGHGTKHRPVVSKALGKIYQGPRLSGGWAGVDPTEYETVRNMPEKERKSFLAKRRAQFRTERGWCRWCGKENAMKKEDGTISSYGPKCWQRLQDWGAERKAKGICMKCNDPAITLPDGSKSEYCQKHYRMSLSNAKQWRDKKREVGICIDCGKEPVSIDSEGNPYVKCNACRELNRKQNKKAYDAAIAQGKCTICGADAAEDRFGKKLIRCKGCIEKDSIRNKQTTQKRKESGMCSRCGQEPVAIDKEGNPYTQCATCREYEKQRVKSLDKEEPPFDYHSITQ